MLEKTLDFKFSLILVNSSVLTFREQKGKALKRRAIPEPWRSLDINNEPSRKPRTLVVAKQIFVINLKLKSRLFKS